MLALKCSPWHGELAPLGLCLERTDSSLLVSGSHKETGTLGAGGRQEDGGWVGLGCYEVAWPTRGVGEQD